MSSTFVSLAGSDNKHGECCGCPAIMSDGRFFTQWQPHGLFNQRVRAATNPDSETQRSMLQQKPELSDIDGMTEQRLVCRADPKFYVDSSNFHQQMSEAQNTELRVPYEVGGFVHRQLFPIDGSYKF